MSYLSKAKDNVANNKYSKGISNPKEGFGSWFGQGSFLGNLGNAMGFGPGDHSAENKAQDLLDQDVHGYDNISTPEFENLDLNGTSYAGDISPERVGYNPASAVSQGDSNLRNVVTDPRLKEAQLKALASLQDVGDSGGMTMADKANLARIQNDSASADASRRAAILQNMQQRGMGGSGSELLAQLSSSQAATDRQAQQGLDVAGMAQQRALQSLQDAGGLAGNLRGQDYGEKANAAAAQDAIDRFNAQNQTAMNTDNAHMGYQAGLNNAQMGLQAQATNQGARQGVYNKNTDTANQQQYFNQFQIPQQNYQNQMGLQGAKSGTLQNSAKYYQDKAGIGAASKSAAQGASLGALGKIGSMVPWGKVGEAVGIGGGAAAGSGSAMAGGDAAEAAQYASYAWKGGKVPGVPHVPGDHFLNDTQTVHVSPGEVIVPRTVAQHPKQAANFVAHAPTISPDKNKEAMLSAIRNLHRRGGR